MTSVQTFLLPKAVFDRILDGDPRDSPHFARIVLDRIHVLVGHLAESLRRRRTIRRGCASRT
jgi:hypothetical protein